VNEIEKFLGRIVGGVGRNILNDLTSGVKMNAPSFGPNSSSPIPRPS